MNQIVKIVPGPLADGTGAHHTSGTKVLLPSGEELPGVTKVVLVADPGNVWRAEIHCYATMEPIAAEATIFRMVPPGIVEVTDSGHAERRFVRSPVDPAHDS